MLRRLRNVAIFPHRILRTVAGVFVLAASGIVAWGLWNSWQPILGVLPNQEGALIIAVAGVFGTLFVSPPRLAPARFLANPAA